MAVVVVVVVYTFSHTLFLARTYLHREPHKNRRGIEEGVRWRGESSHPRVNAPCSLNPEGTQQGTSESSQSSVTVRDIGCSGDTGDYTGEEA